MTGVPILDPARAGRSRRAVLLTGLGAVAMTMLTGSRATASVSVAPEAATFRSVRDLPVVAPPVRLSIPAAGVDTPLSPLHRAPDLTVEVPTDFAVAGWFADGPRPGQAGPAVILGHVDSTRGPAVFYRLRALTPDADVRVLRADGSTVGFRVTGMARVPKTAFPTAEVYGASLEPALHLITCGGRFNRALRSYDDNIIVYADLADGE